MDAGGGGGLLWEGQGLYGGDLNKLWLRTEGERVDSATEAADVEVLIRADSGTCGKSWPGCAMTSSRFFAILGGHRRNGAGATEIRNRSNRLYLGDAGRTALRFEAEYRAAADEPSDRPAAAGTQRAW
jgi:copper resistance protein B